MKKDPVCGMQVSSDEIAFNYKDTTHYFCSTGCLETFVESPDDYFKKNVFELIIIGGGPAGLTAAVYASISKTDTFFITDNIGGQAVDSTKIKNYMGYDFIGGQELVAKFQEQFITKHYLAHKIDRVVNIHKTGNGYEITTLSKEKFFACSVIIATGMKKRKVGIPGEERLTRKGVSYHAVQDTGLFKDLDVVVIGGGNSALQTAQDLAQINCHVSIVTIGKLIADQKDIEQVRTSKNIDIYENNFVTEIKGEVAVEAVAIKSENTGKTFDINCNGVFIQVGFVPNTEFCAELIELNNKGEIIINPDCSTSAPGIFACGDVTNAYGKRIIIATGEGAKAALRAKEYISQLKKTRTVKQKNISVLNVKGLCGNEGLI